MENALNFLFEKKEYENIQDFVFKGLRCSDDVMYKLMYIIGELCGVPSVYLQIEDDEDGVNTYVCDIDDLKGMEDISYDDEEIEDDICDN